jgi:DNA-binding MltR family transcriptional regulator
MSRVQKSRTKAPFAEQDKSWLSELGERTALFNKTVEELSIHRDRELAIVASSLMDDVLKDLLLSCIVDISENHKKSLFDISAPLGTFSARINLSGAFGFISKKQRDDLNCIRNIRNEFAHSYTGHSFSDEPMKSLCGSLKLVSSKNYAKLREGFAAHDEMLETSVGEAYVHGKLIEIAVTDENQNAILWVRPLEVDFKNPRKRFINSIKILYMSIVTTTLLRYQKIGKFS